MLVISALFTLTTLINPFQICPEGLGDLLHLIWDNENIVAECIKKMKQKLSFGHDGVPVALIKTYRDLATPVLYEIFDKSFKSGMFLECGSSL